MLRTWRTCAGYLTVSASLQVLFLDLYDSFFHSQILLFFIISQIIAQVFTSWEIFYTNMQILYVILLLSPEKQMDSVNTAAVCPGRNFSERTIFLMKAYQRLLSYVKISTPSNEESASSPSSQCQFDLARLLVEELKDLGDLRCVSG